MTCEGIFSHRKTVTAHSVVSSHRSAVTSSSGDTALSRAIHSTSGQWLSSFRPDATASSGRLADGSTWRVWLVELLDHDLPPEMYLDAVTAVEAGRDRAEPVVPFKRPAPSAVKDGGKKLLEKDEPSPEAKALAKQANRIMLESDGKMDFLEALNAVEAGKTRLDLED